MGSDLFLTGIPKRIRTQEGRNTADLSWLFKIDIQRRWAGNILPKNISIMLSICCSEHNLPYLSARRFEINFAILNGWIWDFVLRGEIGAKFKISRSKTRMREQMEITHPFQYREPQIFFKSLRDFCDYCVLIFRGHLIVVINWAKFWSAKSN